jgi:hypothetical protein
MLFSLLLQLCQEKMNGLDKMRVGQIMIIAKSMENGFLNKMIFFFQIISEVEQLNIMQQDQSQN